MFQQIGRVIHFVIMLFAGMVERGEKTSTKRMKEQSVYGLQTLISRMDVFALVIKKN